MSLLEQFDYLRNSDPKNRLDATLKIFAILDLPNKAVAPVSTLAQLEESYGTDTQYTFTRLIKGLASSRESARLGFSAALSELLRSLPKIDTAMVLDAIEKATIPGGNIKGQETRDYQFGRLFGLQALCSSGLLSREERTMEDITPVLVLLYELAMSKGWLRESCASVIIQILDSLAKAKSTLTEECAESAYEMLYTAQLSKTMEGIAIALKCKEYGASRSSTDWSHEDILHADNLGPLNKLMRDLNSTNETTEGDTQTGTWKPKLHFSWLTLISAILSSDRVEHIQFPDFWRIVVDEGLFSANASHERKFWGFQLFNVLVQRLPAQALATLFSPNFLRTLGNQISQNDRFLNKAAKNCAATMIIAAQENPDKVVTILSALWDFNFFFDRLSKDKTCESLMVLTPVDRLEELVTMLIKQSNPPTSKIDIPMKEVEKRRQAVSDHLLTLLRSSKIAKSGHWIILVLNFFTIHGFFKVTKPKKSPFVFEPELSEASRQVYQLRLQSALSCLMPTTTAASDSTIYVSAVVQTMAEYRTKKYFELVLQPDETLLSLLEATEKKLAKLERKRVKSASGGDEALAFIFLYSLTMVQIYTGEGDAVQVLEDLDDCYTQQFKNERPADEPERDSMEVMMDLLLSFLSRESVLFRKLVDSVFAVFAPKMTKASMELLLNVLTADESGEALFDKDDGDDGDDDDDDDDEEAIAQDEADRASASEDDDDDDVADDAEDDMDDDEANQERDAALDAALANALGNSGSGGKKRKASSELSPAGEGRHESDFEADSDSEEDLMDDDQMLAMDAALENIFKRRKQESSRRTNNSRKQDREGMKTSTIQFKRKVLDLLDSFVKLQPASERVLDLILPVLRSARDSTDAGYAEKAQTLLRQRVTKSRTLPVLDTLTADGVMDLLRAVHGEAERASTPPQSTTCSLTSLFLVRLVASLDHRAGGDDDDQSASAGRMMMEEMVGLYAQTQVRWLRKKRSRLTAGFFVDFVNWCTQWRVNRSRKRDSTAAAAAVAKEDGDRDDVDESTGEHAIMAAPPGSRIRNRKQKGGKKQLGGKGKSGPAAIA